MFIFLMFANDSCYTGLKLILEKEVWFRVSTKSEIVCTLHSLPSNVNVSFSWFHNNLRINECGNNTMHNVTEVSVNGISSKIIFGNTSFSQSGYYKCEAVVNQLKKSATVKVNVGGK